MTNELPPVWEVIKDIALYTLLEERGKPLNLGKEEIEKSQNLHNKKEILLTHNMEEGMDKNELNVSLELVDRKEGEENE